MFSHSASLTEFLKSRKNLENLIKTKLWAKLLLALALGVLTGYIAVSLELKTQGSWAKSFGDWAALPGSIYLSMIQMVIVPLILSSIILSLSNIGKGRETKTIGTSAIFFVIISTLLAAAIGVIVTYLLNPGEAIGTSMEITQAITAPETKKFSISPQFFLSFIPLNPLASLLKGDLLEVLILSVIFGLVISQMEEKQSATILSFLNGIQSLCLKMIAFAMKLAPYAVFGLMLRAVIHAGVAVLWAMLGYVVSAFIGFLLMVAMYCAWLLFIGVNPLSFLKKSSESLLLAFSLSSSAATMPTTLRIAQEELHVRNEISQLLIPLGTTINMAGSAIWQSSATIFLAQAFGESLPISSVLLVIVLTIGASIGTPGVPGAGLGVLTSTLKSVGVPPSGISLLLGIDRLVDMGCTALNVMGDLVMCLTAEWIIQRKEKSHDT